MNVIITPPEERETWENEGRSGYTWVVERRKYAPGLDDLLKWAYRLGASRIDFKTGHPVTILVHGKVRCATRGATDDFAIADIVSHMYARRNVVAGQNFRFDILRSQTGRSGRNRAHDDVHILSTHDFARGEVHSKTQGFSPVE